MKSLKKVSILICFFLLSACYESLDFNQIENHVSKPIITSALAYFTVVPSQFFDATGIQQYNITDVTEFRGLNNGYVRDNLVKIDFNAEIRNEFDRDVTIQVDFLDYNKNVVYSFAPILVSENNLNYKYFEEIVISSNPSILNTNHVRISATLENTGTQMNPNDLSEFVFKSAVTLYIEAEL